MNESITQRVATLSLQATAVLAIMTAPAAAQTPENCTPPENLQPLFDLLNSITELAFLGGVGLATLGFTTAGLLLILPGQDNTRLGKSVAKNVLIGSILLLSANMIVSFLVNELGTTICS
ncbi:hypothetical protein BRC72_11500 [Halobacteriales archaeon QH_7_66_36]|nr:MAG: hypothetical protein BRC72_11500 [Halobacteriales archaeon QH_7_66_36]